ncbi:MULTISPECIES: hypothetical protein [unclassified Moorena]|uniref:hypothetical protein n=1 Tax=unclassified Moorena TaxID=2683338 RepID=UPI0014014D84|nr:MULTISPECIES: hypothetical protein [unclassified Moorena]NEO16563.1 hypothetical protein [Moorena sp. SIO3E8]NEQ03093.1 hypothetical protein [Moorena sp. SIO3F7]
MKIFKFLLVLLTIFFTTISPAAAADYWGVSAGSSWDLDQFRPLYRYTLPPGKTPDDIVGMGSEPDCDGGNTKHFVWFDDRTVSAGSSSNLDRFRPLYGYSLPPGKTPDDIVGMGSEPDCDGGNTKHFVWFK